MHFALMLFVPDIFEIKKKDKTKYPTKVDNTKLLCYHYLNGFLYLHGSVNWLVYNSLVIEYYYRVTKATD